MCEINHTFLSISVVPTIRISDSTSYVFSKVFFSSSPDDANTPILPTADSLYVAKHFPIKKSLCPVSTYWTIVIKRQDRKPPVALRVPIWNPLNRTLYQGRHIHSNDEIVVTIDHQNVKFDQKELSVRFSFEIPPDPSFSSNNATKVSQKYIVSLIHTLLLETIKVSPVDISSGPKETPILENYKSTNASFSDTCIAFQKGGFNLNVYSSIKNLRRFDEPKSCLSRQVELLRPNGPSSLIDSSSLNDKVLLKLLKNANPANLQGCEKVKVWADILKYRKKSKVGLYGDYIHLILLHVTFSTGNSEIWKDFLEFLKVGNHLRSSGNLISAIHLFGPLFCLSRISCACGPNGPFAIIFQPLAAFIAYTVRYVGVMKLKNLLRLKNNIGEKIDVIQDYYFFLFQSIQLEAPILSFLRSPFFSFLFEGSAREAGIFPPLSDFLLTLFEEAVAEYYQNEEKDVAVPISQFIITVLWSFIGEMNRITVMLNERNRDIGENPSSNSSSLSGVGTASGSMGTATQPSITTTPTTSREEVVKVELYHTLLKDFILEAFTIIDRHEQKFQKGGNQLLLTEVAAYQLCFYNELKFISKQLMQIRRTDERTRKLWDVLSTTKTDPRDSASSIKLCDTAAAVASPKRSESTFTDDGAVAIINLPARRHEDEIDEERSVSTPLSRFSDESAAESELIPCSTNSFNAENEEFDASFNNRIPLTKLLLGEVSEEEFTGGAAEDLSSNESSSGGGKGFFPLFLSRFFSNQEKSKRPSIGIIERISKVLMQKYEIPPKSLLFERTINSHKPFPLPMNMSVQYKKVIAKESYVVKSTRCPFVVRSETAAEDSSVFEFLFKEGDDLRQDAMALAILGLFENKALFPLDVGIRSPPLDRNSRLEKTLACYTVLPTSLNEGMVEFIKKATSISSIRDCLTDKRTISTNNTTYSTTINTEEPSSQLETCFVERFIQSCALFSVVTFALGVGDRHLDNVLVDKSGKMAHIDYGFLFGADPKLFSPPPIKLCAEMVALMGGLDSPGFETFKLCCAEALLPMLQNSELLASCMCSCMFKSFPDIWRIRCKSGLLKRGNLGGATSAAQLSSEYTTFVFPKWNLMSNFAALDSTKKKPTSEEQYTDSYYRNLRSKLLEAELPPLSSDDDDDSWIDRSIQIFEIICSVLTSHKRSSATAAHQYNFHPPVEYARLSTELTLRFRTTDVIEGKYINNNSRAVSIFLDDVVQKSIGGVMPAIVDRFHEWMTTWYY